MLLLFPDEVGCLDILPFLLGLCFSSPKVDEEGWNFLPIASGFPEAKHSLCFVVHIRISLRVRFAFFRNPLLFGLKF